MKSGNLFFYLIGYRMPPPDGMPDRAALLMNKCWEEDPKSRPAFKEIYNEVHQIVLQL